MVWNKISSLFRRVPSDLLNLQGEIQTKLSNRILRKFPKWIEKNTDIPGGGVVSVKHLVDYLLQREGPEVPKSLSIGVDESAPTESVIGKYRLTTQLQNLFRQALKATNDPSPEFVDDDEIVSMAFQLAVDGSGVSLGEGFVPNTGRLAAGFFAARSQRWNNTENALAGLSALPVQAELSDALNVSGLEVWLLMRRSVFQSHTEVETWQNDLKDALSIIKGELSSKPESAKTETWNLTLGRINHWQQDHERGRELLSQCFENNKSLSLRDEIAHWDMIASEKPSLETLAELWAIQTWREKMADLASQFDDELESSRGEVLWELIVQARCQAEDLSQSLVERQKDSAAALVVRAELMSLTEDLGFLDGPFRKNEALECLDKAIELLPKNGLLHSNRARVRLTDDETGQMVDPASELAEQAFEDLCLASELNVEDARLTAAALALDRAAAMSSKENTKQWIAKSVELFDKLLADGHLDFDTVRGACRAYLSSERAEESLKIVERAIAANPENSEIIIFAAHICLDLGEADKAAKYVDQALNLDPDNPDAMMLAARSRFDESIDDLE